MSIWGIWRQDGGRRQVQRERVMGVHDRLVDHLLKLTGSGSIGIPDEYELRFEMMVFFASYILYSFRDDAQFSQDFWEVVFEGFQESLRIRGVTDIRMAARMKQTMQDATGRRNVYVVAWENGDQEGLRRAVARNILCGAEVDDARIDNILLALEDVPDMGKNCDNVE
jgi:hypothetical protein